MNVAIVGMGRMGSAMARRLHEQGFELAVYNRTRAKAESTAEHTGSRVAESAADAVSRADVVISILADDQALREAYLGEAGIASGLREGTVVLEMSTIDPRTLDDLRPAVTAAGAVLLDAPVSGSVGMVEAGTLMVMIGGDEQALDKARPVLDKLATKVYHLGASGAGSTMKLAVNGLVHAINQALSEALVLAERSGVPPELAYEVFANSAAASPFVAYKRAAFLDPDAAPVAFSLDLVAKDLDLILGLAERSGARMPQGEANLAWATRAVAMGLGSSDMSALAVALRSSE
ncbi:MAG: NAD(P)-dependent oxidoreductase [Acidimicrobiia bacterium]|nr:NAD(P)-dependent oxidoreductase [Acidimicrobiia bacterium]MDH4307623.1 NAD(P)-dependent oxidoreductase [Acidimicrobiia bacterium]MDH5294107.1 NAD(P)-dependent oxidoreductase [Acidimicrobiia bacterium]